MFDKSKFAQIIKSIKETYDSQEDFSKKSNIGRTYLSQYMNMKLDEPPKPKTLEKLANASNGITSFKELMQICGYSEKNIENIVSVIYKNLKEFHKYINNGKSDKDNFYQITSFVEKFQAYIFLLEKNLTLPTMKPILLTDIFEKDYMLEDYQYVFGFLMLYDNFIKYLEKEKYVIITKQINIDYFDIESIYENLTKFENMELFSYSNKYIAIKKRERENINFLIEDMKNFSTYLNLAYLSDFDTNTLTELFKKKALKNNEDETIDTPSLAKSNELNTEGLDEEDIEELNRFVEFLKAKKKQDKK